jgi:hypothetical protein
MYFAKQSIDQLAADLEGIPGKRDEVLEALLSRAYEVPRAKEFAAHGVSRRLRTMAHCIENVFNILPPEREEHPSMEELVDAVVYIQAFTFNTFACLDNLAWIWVCEKKLTTDKGEIVPPTKVGLGKKYRIVRRSLPTDLQKHLKTLDPWFEHLENFRHALAHRIPLYIPPCAVTEQDLPAYRLLEKQMAKASRRGNSGRYEQLRVQQQALTKYQPEMMHSAADNSSRVVFHPQLLSDFKAVCELGLKMNAALDEEPATSARRVFWSSVFNVGERLGRLWAAVRRPS